MTIPSFPQFQDEYDGHAMRTLVDELARWVQSLQQQSPQSGGGGGGTVTSHNELTGRESSDAHPIESITGLLAALDGKCEQADCDAIQDVVNTHEARLNVAELTLNDHEIRIDNLEGVVPLAKRLDETSPTVLYFGEAQPGSADSAAVWRIQRITFITPGEDDIEVLWAGGSSTFSEIWDDRLSLSYS